MKNQDEEKKDKNIDEEAEREREMRDFFFCFRNL